MVCAKCGVVKCCLGGEPTVDLYVEHLVAVFREVRRVLRDDGTLWLNLGDSYGRIRARWAGNASRGVNGMDGQLLGAPWRVALALQADGWLLRNDVQWIKSAPMPESVSPWQWRRHRIRVASATVKRDGLNGSGQRPHGATISEPQRLGAWPDRPQQEHDGHDFKARTEWADCLGCEKCTANGGLVLRRGMWRHTRAHEIIFMLAKTDRYFADGEAVKEAAAYGNHRRTVFDNGPPPPPGAPPHTGLRHAPGPTAGRNPRSFMLLGPEPLRESHYAAMPTEIPRRLIAASTSARGVCRACGAPWAPIVERSAMVVVPPDRGRRQRNGETGNANGRMVTSGQMIEPPASRTSGWRATCPCPAADPVPATVLDPFAGSGTTGVVAAELGRHAILCDLSGTYLRDIAGRRVGAAALAGQVSRTAAATQDDLF